MQDDLQPLGYDPTQEEPITVTPAPKIPFLPSAFVISEGYLPPPGKQASSDCAAWSSTYGLASVVAAQAHGCSPDNMFKQASPAYIYIQVMKKYNENNNNCRGSNLSYYFDLLAQGTPSLAKAPYPDNGCTGLWGAYGNTTLPPDTLFRIRKDNVTAVNAKVPEEIKNILASGRPLVYGTSLYTDFNDYKGQPISYTGNGEIWVNRNGQRVGHCMLIIGYDDYVGNGSFRIQNSHGQDWGDKGRCWMDYQTFSTLAQGQAFYIR